MAIPVPEKRILDFEEMGFGMFVHWGLYSQMGRGEWAKYLYNIPQEEYGKLADTFTASKFDAQKMAQIAKKAGVKYITLTTRHHDGFSLYDTKGLNTYDAPHSAAGRDLIREFVDGCRAEGIVPFFYHTTLDWYNPDFKNDFKTYLQYLRDSVEILCSEYGKIGGLWFDGNWSRQDDWEEDALYAVIRKHQPDAIIVNNTGLGARGALGNPELDSVTFEQGRPEPMNRDGMPKYIAAEMCQTMNRHWGHGANDLHYKSLPELIETLCYCRKMGANYLLNIGPAPEGDVTIYQQALLEGLGQWIRTCGQSIYKARPCGVKGPDKDFALRDGNKIYFYIHNLFMTEGDAHVTIGGGGPGERLFTNVPGTVSNLHWVDNGESLEYTQDEKGFLLNATGYHYGTDLVVRVAEADIAD